MKKLIILFVFILSGCSQFGQTKQQSKSVNLTDNQNGTGINPYTITEFPVPQQQLTRCIVGQINEIISGNEATTIWYVTQNQVGLTNVRLPHTYPLKIKIVEKGFCYDYFDVTFNNQ